MLPTGYFCFGCWRLGEKPLRNELLCNSQCTFRIEVSDKDQICSLRICGQHKVPSRNGGKGLYVSVCEYGADRLEVMLKEPRVETNALLYTCLPLFPALQHLELRGTGQYSDSMCRQHRQLLGLSSLPANFYRCVLRYCSNCPQPRLK